MGSCCGIPKKDQNIFRSMQHIGIERAIEYKTNSGIKILIDKEDFLLGEYFLENEITKFKDREVQYNKMKNNFKENLRKLSFNEMMTLSGTLKFFITKCPEKFWKITVEIGLP